METKKTEVKKERVCKINISYINFIAKVKAEKLQESNAESLVALYIEEVKLRPTNIKRVDFRNKRAEVKETLATLLKERDISTKEYTKLTNLVVDKISKSKNSNYLTVKA